MAKKAAIIALSLGLVVYLLSQFDAREVLRVISEFPPGYLAGGFALFIAGHFVRSIRIRILLGGGPPVGGIFRMIALQTAAVVFLPLRGGDFSLMYLLKSEHEVEYSKGAAVLVLAKTLDFLVVVTLFLVSSGILPVVPGVYSELLPWAGGAFFVIVAVLLLFGRSSEIYAMLPAFFREGPLAEGAFMSAVKKVMQGMEVIRSRKTLAASVAVSMALWICLYGSNFLVIRGVGLELGLMEMVFLVTSMTLFANLPIHSPGGFGTTEAFWTGVLFAMGVSKETGIATGFASHIITIAFTLLFMLYGLAVAWKKPKAGKAEEGGDAGR